MKGDVHQFVVMGKPIAKKRPRFVTAKAAKTGNTFTRNVNIQQTEEGRFLWECLLTWNNQPILLGALKLDCEFVFDRPKSHYGTGKNSDILKGTSPLLCNKVSQDVDNELKFLCDSLNKYIYLDDRQIVEIHAIKRWSKDDEVAHTSFFITELE